MENFYTTEKVAELTGFTERYVRDRISDGSLKAYKTGRKWFILHSDLVIFIKSETDGKDMSEKPKRGTKTQIKKDTT